MVVEIGIAEGKSVESLTEQLVNCMLDSRRISMIYEALSKPLHDSPLAVNLAKQHQAAV